MTQTTCGGCGAPLEISDDDKRRAELEALENFGAEMLARDATAALCDDCYPTFMAWYRTLTPAQHAAIQNGRLNN